MQEEHLERFASAAIYRRNSGEYIGGFIAFTGNVFAFRVELMETILAIESDLNRGWFYLWIETNSILVAQVFRNYAIVPWILETNEEVAYKILKGYNLRLHTYIEKENVCAKIYSKHWYWYASWVFFYSSNFLLLVELTFLKIESFYQKLDFLTLLLLVFYI